MSLSSSAAATAAAASTSGSSSSPATASSWFSGIVRGRGDKSGSAKLSKSSSMAGGGSGSGDFGGPIKGKNQFRGVLFKYGPKSIQVAFKTGEYKQQVIFIGGLTHGLLATDYLEPLAIALDKEKWSLVQLLMSSSYSGFGTSSLKQDAQEIDQLINYLINKENSEGVVLVGHSTGCQDIVFYMGTNAACSRAVRAAILQAPVSDREYKATLPETPAMIDLAANMIKEGRGEELMPREADPCAPISAYRYHSLCAYMGDDDMFSSDLSDDQLKTRLGHMANTPCQVIFSMGDEYVPEYVDKKALVNRLSKAMGGAEKVEIEHGNHSLSNRVHEAVQAIIGFVKREGPNGMNFRSLLVFSMLLRLFLIVYGEWQDTHMEVRYTDVDYIVFSDAASLMASGESPYKRTTYRYSPLLALLLTPNSFFHRSWGKFLFSASDLLVGWFIHKILKQRKVPEKICTYSVMVWLLNPFTFTIGTRGNCEPIVCAMILWIIICLMQGNLSQAAFWFGLVVHFRVYPIIYALPIILVLDSQIFRSGQKPALEDWDTGQARTPTSNTEKKTFLFSLLTALKSLFSRERIMFALISGGVFLACNVVSFYFYGHEFLHEALLYHMTRTDPRHNFSIYFYHIYLHYERQFSAVEKLISFLPQFTVQFALVFCFSQDLVFCIFLQTVAFVAFNKVITAQYFVWFYCFLPLILPWSRMKLKWEGLLCIIFWIGAQTHWLLWGYMLEFKGFNVFLLLWMAGLLFLAANTVVLVKIIQSHRFSPLFRQYGSSSSAKNVTKLD